MLSWSGMAEAISVSGLRKSFGRTKALDGLDLHVGSREVHGFLGPNGSGKSTTIRVLLGLLHADGGDVRLLGGDPWRDAIELHRRLSYVPGDVSLWPNLTGGETIDLLTRLRGGVDRRRRDDLLAGFQLDPTKKARTYSKGNRQKVVLIAALASEVELLVLDEPTSGLDPLMETEFQAYVKQLQAEGRTVLLSSHILAEVEALCDRVTIIRLGRTVETGTLADLRHLTRTSIVAETAAAPDRDGGAGRRPQAARRGPQGPVRRRRRAPRSRAPPSHRARRPQPAQRAADTRGAVPAPLRGRAGGMRALAGTGPLIRFLLRRDRVRIPVWVLAITVSLLGSVASFASTYPTAADRQARARVLDSPVASLFVGPRYGLRDYTYGAMTAHELLPLAAVAVALMSIFLAVRHTRAEEETGRTDLVEATAVGHQAATAATLVVVGGTNLLLGVLLAVGLPLSLDGLSAGGSLAFAGALAGVGLVFTGAALVVAQLSRTARGALGAASIDGRGLPVARRGRHARRRPVLAVAVRVGDRDPGVRAGAMVGQSLPLLAAGVLVAAAAALSARRDVGAGLLGDRPGPATGSALLDSPWGLAFRLQRAASPGGRCRCSCWGSSTAASPTGPASCTRTSTRSTSTWSASEPPTPSTWP